MVSSAVFINETNVFLMMLMKAKYFLWYKHWLFMSSSLASHTLSSNLLATIPDKFSPQILSSEKIQVEKNFFLPILLLPFCCISQTKKDKTTGWAFDKPMYLIMNIACAGPDEPAPDDSELPQFMTVDYVRVYELK